jgi:hypothetical protein
VGFVVDKVALGQFHSIGAPLHGKTKQLIVTALHNEPQGCGASLASAAGPFTTKQLLCSFSEMSTNIVTEGSLALKGTGN